MANRKALYKLAMAARERVREKEYWLRKLSGEWVKSSFPYDDFNKCAGSRRLATAAFEFSDKLSSTLIRLSKGSDVRLHIALSAGLNALLYRYTGMNMLTFADTHTDTDSNQNDIVVGASILKSDQGMDFLNTLLVLRTPVSLRINFKDLLKETRQTVIEAIDNRDYPIEILLKQLNLPFSPGDDFPLFDIAILLENIHDRKYFNAVNLNMIFSFTRFESLIKGRLEYNPLLYRETTIKQIIRHFEHLFLEVISNPHIPLSGIEIISPEEKRQILVDFNKTEAGYPKDKTIHELFEEQAEKSPEGIGLVGSWQLAVGKKEKMHITYGVLNEKSGQVAHWLKEKGVLADSIVGIKMERSVEMIIGIIGILKAGGAYLPIETDYPQERIYYMLADSGAKILLTNLPEGRRFHHSSNPLTIHHSSHLAYVIYTSGTTGRPRGVLVVHRSVVRLVKNTDYIEFREKDRILQTGALAFDASTFEIWGALLNGLTLFLVPGEEILTPGTLKHNIRKYDISTMWLTSPLFNRLCGADVEVFGGLRNLLVGGDALSPRHIDMVRERFPGLNVINGYGPTENTTFSTSYLIDRHYEERIPIGKPIAHSTAYIIDRCNKLAPVGVVGELYVGGDGTARGYLNNPELTAEKFMGYRSYRSYRTYFSRRIYKTGDLARWLPDGNIEFFGRIDHQVKIRGFRVELREIESWLLKYPAVKEAVVTARGTPGGDKYLCAYIVPHPGQSTREEGLRQYLSAELPGYMVPSFFTVLEKMPLNPNGKLDRKALPEPAAAPGENYAAPQNEVEEALVGLWSEVLEIEKNRIGIDDNFFQLGGHSLKALDLMGRIHKKLGVEISISEIFKSPSIRGLARYIPEGGKTPFYSIEAVEEKEYYPLSSAQKRMYILQRMDLDSTVYNIPGVFELEDGVDMGKLTETFNRLIQRHESFRTSFPVVKDVPVQRIHNEVEFKIQNSFIRPFDLSKAPLIRVGVVEKHGKQFLLIDMHHIISDGFSQEIMLRDFTVLYRNRDLPPLPLQYKDFAQWQNKRSQSEIIIKQRDYWLKEFSTPPSPLNLHLDFLRSVNDHFKGDAVSCFLDKEKSEKLKILASREDATLYMILMAILYVLMAKISESEDIVLGCAAAGRVHPDLEKIIGMFVNTLAIRCYPQGRKRFVEFLKEVRGKILAAFENQEYQFEELVEDLKVKRETGRHPLFDVLFALQNFTLRGKEDREHNYDENQNAKFDIMIVGIETEGGLVFRFFYRTGLFKRATIERFVEYFKEIAAEVVGEPDKKIEDIEMISKEKQNRLIGKIKQEKDGLDVIESKEKSGVLEADFDEEEFNF